MATDCYDTVQIEHRTYCKISGKLEFIAVKIKTDIYPTVDIITTV